MNPATPTGEAGRHLVDTDLMNAMGIGMAKDAIAATASGAREVDVPNRSMSVHV
jgi:hypothetical protein